MSKNRDDNHIIEARLKEKLKNKYDDDDETLPHHLLMWLEDDHARRSVATLINALDNDVNMPDFTDTVIPDLFVQASGSEALFNSLQDENVGQTSFYKGLESNDLDLANWNQYEVLKDLFRKEPEYTNLTNSVFQGLIFSNNIPPTGRGKSSTMYLLSEIAQTVYDDVDIRSNNPNDQYDDVEEYWADVEDWIRSDGRKILLLDEVKQFLMYADQGAGKSVSQILALLRHNKTDLIMVGHTGMVPADIRRQIFVLNKLSKQKMEIGFGIKPMTDDDRFEVSDVLYEFENVPHTSVDYKSQGEEAIQIKFDDDRENEEDQEMQKSDVIDIDYPAEVETNKEKAQYLKEELDMTQSDIADILEVTQAHVSQNLL